MFYNVTSCVEKVETWISKRREKNQVFLSFFMWKIFEDCCDTRGRRTDATKNISQMTHVSRAFGIVELRICRTVLGELWNYGIVELWNNMEWREFWKCSLRFNAGGGVSSQWPCTIQLRRLLIQLWILQRARSRWRRLLTFGYGIRRPSAPYRLAAHDWTCDRAIIVLDHDLPFSFA